MSILRVDKIAGLESVNAITGSVKFPNNPGSVGHSLLEIYSGDLTDFDFGSGDFTVECWIYAHSSSSRQIFAYRGNNAGNSAAIPFMMEVTATEKPRAFFYNKTDTTSIEFTGSADVPIEEWFHWAVARHGTQISGYVNGTQIGTVSITAGDIVGNTDAYPSEPIRLGDYRTTGTGFPFNGYISNFRVCVGHAVYKYGQTFTPPTRELVVHFTSPGDESVVLCCQSSGDALKDATGKTIIASASSGSAVPQASTFTPDVGNDHTHGTVLEGGTAFSSLNYLTLPRGTTTQSNRGRGLLMGGYTPTPTGTNLNSITYIDIASSGHDVDFGDLTMARYASGAFSSSTRGILGGGRSPTRQDRIDYVTIAQTGNAIDFGNLHSVNAYNQGTSNETRGLFLGGNTPTYITRIDYVTIASTGDAEDFGDLTDARHGGPGVSSPTRAICMGGYDGSAYVDVIDYVTIATLGHATDFGNLTSAYGYGGGVSNATRGLVGGGANPSGEVTHMDYITIATTANSQDFGDLLYGREHVGAVSNSTRGVWFGGVTPTYQTDIQYAIIATTGSAANWGDLNIPFNVPKGYQSGASDSHGGLV